MEIATAEYFDWFNHRRLDGKSGLVSTVESEAPPPEPRSRPTATLKDKPPEGLVPTKSICMKPGASQLCLIEDTRLDVVSPAAARGRAETWRVDRTLKRRALAPENPRRTNP